MGAAEAGKNSKNDAAKKTFDFLAENETFHIKTINEFISAMKEKGGIASVKWESAKAKREDELSIFSQSVAALKGKIKQNEDEKKAYEFAMEFENSGYKYYENMLKDSKDENLSEFLKFLLKEESKHYDLLSNTYVYLTDSKNWYMFEEGSFPQG